MFSLIANDIIPTTDAPERTVLVTGLFTGAIGYPITPQALLCDYPDTVRREVEMARQGKTLEGFLQKASSPTMRSAYKLPHIKWPLAGVLQEQRDKTLWLT
jgi:hypothetical protein